MKGEKSPKGGEAGPPALGRPTSDGMGEATGTQKQGKGGIGPGRFPGAGKCGKERVSYSKRSETDLQGQVR